MAAEATISIDRDQARRLQRELRAIRGGFAKVQDRAIRDTTRGARVQTVRLVAAEVAIPQSKLYQRGNPRRPVQERLLRQGADVIGGRVTVALGRLPLGRFSAKQHWRSAKSGGRRRSYVSYRISKAGGRQKIKEEAFAVTFDSGYTGVFKRAGKGRLPLIELHGPSIPQVMENEGRFDQVARDAERRLIEVASRRAELLLKRRSARIG